MISSRAGSPCTLSDVGTRRDLESRAVCLSQETIWRKGGAPLCAPLRLSVSGRLETDSERRREVDRGEDFALRVPCMCHASLRLFRPSSCSRRSCPASCVRIQADGWCLVKTAQPLKPLSCFRAGALAPAMQRSAPRKPRSLVAAGAWAWILDICIPGIPGPGTDFTLNAPIPQTLYSAGLQLSLRSACCNLSSEISRNM